MNKRIFLSTVICAAVIFSGFSVDKFSVSAKESSELVKCATPEFDQSYRFSKAVFVGKVTAIKEKGDKKIFEFKVIKYWKGIKTKKVEVGYYETSRYQAWYEIGKDYLVYARGEDDGSLVDGRCSRSREIGDNFIAQDLKKLGKGKK